MKTLKRRVIASVLSVVTAVTMLLGNYVPAVAADADETNYNSVTVTTDEGIKVTKSAEYYIGDDGKDYVDVSFEVDGANAKISETTSGKSEIIFVMDISNSMNESNKLKNARNAAKSFAERLLSNNADGNVKVGIVAFGTNGHTILSPSADVNKVKKALDDTKVGYNSDDGGTNIQAGIKTAQNAFSSDDSKKIMVLLSDGEPTYSYEATSFDLNPTVLNDGSNVYLLNNFTNTRKGNGSEYRLSSYNAYTIDPSSGKEYVVKEGYWLFGTYYYIEIDGEEYTSYRNANGQVIELTSRDKGKKVTHYRRYYLPVSNNGIPTVSQAQLAKNAGISVYTIGYEIGNNANARFTLQNTASAGKFNTAGTFTIASVLSDITTQVESEVDAAKGAKLEDVFPAYMTLSENSVDDSSATVNVDERKVTWSLGDLGKDKDKAITITVALDVEAMIQAYADANNMSVEAVKQTMSTEEVWFAMNDDVLLTYTNAEGEEVSNNDISVSSQVGVPLESFKTNKVSVKYMIDGAETDASYDDYCIPGRQFTVTSLDYDKDQYTEAITVDGTALNGNSFTMPAKDVEVVVTYTSIKYAVTYVDGFNGETLGTEEVAYNSYPVAAPDLTTDERVDHTADGKKNPYWDNVPSETQITGTTTFTVNYDDVVPTVTFVVKVDNVPVYTSETYTVDFDGSKDYPSEFLDYTVEGSTENGVNTTYTEKAMAVSGTATLGNTQVTNIKSENTVVTREFVKESKYLVTFMVVNEGDDTSAAGKTLYSEYHTTGDVVTAPSLDNYSEETDNTAKYTYTMGRWSQTSVTVENSPVVVTATRTSAIKEFDITFKFVNTFDSTQNKTKTVKYKYDEVPSLPEELQGFEPATSDAQYTYSYTGWPTFDIVTGAATYTATYSRSVNSYTYTFELKYYEIVDGERVEKTKTISSDTVDYGATDIIAPEITENDLADIAMEGYRYSLTYPEGWTPGSAIAKIEGNVTYTAVYDYKKVHNLTVNYQLLLEDYEGNLNPVTTAAYTVLSEGFVVGDTVELPAYISVENDWQYEYNVTLDGIDKYENFTYSVEDDMTITVTRTGKLKEYEVKFIVDDCDEIIGEVTKTVKAGTDATQYAPSLDVSDRDLNTYTYTVSEWDKAFNKIESDTEVHASITKKYIIYYVNFLYAYYNNGGGISYFGQQSQRHYNDTIEIPAYDPVHESDAEWTYEISDWTDGEIILKPGDIYTVTSSTSFNASESRTKNKYNVTFLLDIIGGPNPQSAVVQKVIENVPYGDIVENQNPTIEVPKDTDEWHYEFTDYDKTTYEVKGNITATATITATKKVYTVTFRNYNGQVLKTQNVAYGNAATAPEVPGRATDYYDDGSRREYTFAGWSGSFNKIVGNTVVDARFSDTYYSAPTPNPQPDNPQPDDPQPDNPQPDNPQPDNPQPDNPQPDNPQPGNPEPDEPEPEVVIEPEPVPQAPEVEIEPEPAPLAPEVEIEEEDVPLAAADHCLVHWIVLLSSVLYGAYVAVRGISLKKENEAKLGTSNN